MRHYDILDERTVDGFRIVIDKTWEDIDPRGQFEECDVDEIVRKINNDTYDWFMLRVRALFDGNEMGSAYLGGCLYEDARDVLKDGVAEDMIAEAVAEAKAYAKRLKEKLDALTV